MNIGRLLSGHYDEWFEGKWRIVHTDMWDDEALDRIVPAYISFGKEGMGRMRLIAVDVDVDYRSGAWGGTPLVEFTFLGEDDGDPTSGRGWARLEDDKLRGRVFFHRGDESLFVAESE